MDINDNIAAKHISDARGEIRAGNFNRAKLSYIIDSLQSDYDGQAYPEPILDQIEMLIYDIRNHLDNIGRDSSEYKELQKILHEANVAVEDEEWTIPDIGVNSSDNVVLLLGAGASHASGIPLVTQLLEKLAAQADRMRDDTFSKLLNKCRRDGDIDIEDLLTAVYLAEFAVSEPSTLSLLHHFLFTDESNSGPAATLEDVQTDVNSNSVNYIQNTIQTLFRLIASEMVPDKSSETHTEIKRFIQNHTNVSILTTNYDCCLEEELFGEMEVNTILNKVDSTAAGGDAVELYKMHGSINWQYCDSCQSVDGVHPTTVKNKFDPDSGTLGYPVVGVCPVCRGERRPLLVPPTSLEFVQFPPLIDIRAGAKKCLEDADYIIPVGYSFSDTDAYIHKLVWGAMQRNEETRMLVVDPDGKTVVSKLRNTFGTQSSGFDGTRIEPIAGKSEAVMEELVDELLTYQSGSASEQSGDDEATADDD